MEQPVTPHLSDLGARRCVRAGLNGWGPRPGRVRRFLIPGWADLGRDQRGSGGRSPPHGQTARVINDRGCTTPHRSLEASHELLGAAIASYTGSPSSEVMTHAPPVPRPQSADPLVGRVERYENPGKAETVIKQRLIKTDTGRGGRRGHECAQGAPPRRSSGLPKSLNSLRKRLILASGSAPRSVLAPPRVRGGPGRSPESLSGSGTDRF